MCDAYGLDDGFDTIGAIAQSQQATLERSLGRLRSGGSEHHRLRARLRKVDTRKRWRGSTPTGRNSKRPWAKRGRAASSTVRRSRANLGEAPVGGGSERREVETREPYYVVT